MNYSSRTLIHIIEKRRPTASIAVKRRIITKVLGLESKTYDEKSTKSKSKYAP